LIFEEDGAVCIEFLLILIFDILLFDTGKPELTNGLPEAEAVSELLQGETDSSV